MISKKEAEYRDYPKGVLQCSGCYMFKRGDLDTLDTWDACTLVRGDIVPSGYCKHWEKK